MTAIEFEIRRKRRTGAMQVVSAADFSLRRRGTAVADEILSNPNISLYCLDEPARLALFVETPPTVDLLQDSFMFQGQYRHALKVYGVSYETLQNFTDERGDAWDDLTLIYSVGRCGSTLVARMFGRVPDCLSVSEPDVYSQLVGLALSEEETVQRLRMCTRCLWRPNSGKRHMAIKYRSMGVEHASLMFRAFPEAHYLFLYRHAEPFVVSAMRAFGYPWSPLWAFNLLYRVPIARQLLKWYFARNYDEQVRFAPFAGKFKSNELVELGPVAVLTITWVSAMQQCLAMEAAKIPVLTIRYEDLLASPSDVVAEIMRYCRVKPEDVPATMDAMAEDAQRDSILARDKRRKWTLTEKHRATIREVLERHPVIRSPDFQLPTTLRVFPRLHATEGDERRRSVG